MRIPIPPYAKKSARIGLEQRSKQKNPSGLTPKEAKKLGIESGVSRAYQLINNKKISVKDAKSIYSFLSRFSKQDSPRAKVAINLWGGRKFRMYLKSILNSMK